MQYGAVIQPAECRLNIEHSAILAWMSQVRNNTCTNLSLSESSSVYPRELNNTPHAKDRLQEAICSDQAAEYCYEAFAWTAPKGQTR
jgi:hypothetical protein